MTHVCMYRDEKGCIMSGFICLFSWCENNIELVLGLKPFSI